MGIEEVGGERREREGGEEKGRREGAWPHI